MTTLTNSFEGGTNGTTLTTGNTGGASGNAFDTVSTGTNCTNAFDNTRAAHGTLSCKLASGATSTAITDQWAASIGSSATMWFRQYLFFTANPSSNVQVAVFKQSATVCATVRISTTGQIQFLNAAAATIFTMATALPTNVWFRLEGFCTGAASTGQVQLKIFTSMDSVTATETQTSAANQSLTGAADRCNFGIANNTTSTGPFWMDDLGLSNTGPLGPAYTLAPPQQLSVPRRTPARAYVQGTPSVIPAAAAATPGPFTLTGGLIPYAGGVILQTFSQTFTSSGSWTAPANLAGPPSVYAWGPSGTAATGTAGTGAGGGGGGGIGVEPALGGVTPGSTVLAVTVGAAGTGNPTTVTGGSVTVQGNAGGNASIGTGGVAGAASSNSVTFAGGTGGNGAAGGSGGGGGGGGSAGPTGAGGNGSPGASSTGGAGGTAGTGNPGGAAGGAGGTGSNGSAGTAPGGAGGGGSGGATHTGGAATDGQALITWQTLVPVQMAMQRRTPGRAQIQFTQVRTTNPAAAAPTPPKQQPGPAWRRTPARAYVQFRPVTTTNAVPAVVPPSIPPAIPTSGGDRGYTIRVFREIRPGDVPASGAQMPKLTGRAFAMPVAADVEHVTHSWEAQPEDEPVVPSGPGLAEQVRAELDELTQAARDAAAAIDRAADRARPVVEALGSKAYDLGKIFGNTPYDPRPRKVCGATRMTGGVVLTCQRNPHDDGWHSDKGLHWR